MYLTYIKLTSTVILSTTKKFDFASNNFRLNVHSKLNCMYSFILLIMLPQQAKSQNNHNNNKHNNLLDVLTHTKKNQMVLHYSRNNNRIQ